MFYCRNCLNNSYRPRITFNKEGICNACVHHVNKFNGTIDWNARRKRFEEIANTYKRSDGYFDLIIPCSGGKDSSFIAHKCKTEFGLKPLLVSCRPLIPMRVGQRNLETLIYVGGFDHIQLTCNPDEIRRGSRDGFVTQGRPWHVFDTMISASISKLALAMNIPWILFAEEGEEEYGGKSNPPEKFNREYLLDAYYCGHDPSDYGWWWQMPTQEQLDQLFITHWSKYFDFDGEVHAKYCQEELGFEMLVGGHIGSFTNYDSLDDCTRDLHMLLAFTKFGTGRCHQFATFEIRRGRMAREEGIKICQRLDGQVPLEFLPAYLDYYKMARAEFWQTIEKFVDWKILYATGNEEKPYALRHEYGDYDVFMPDGCDGINFDRGKFSCV